MNRRYRRLLREKKNSDTKATIYHAWGNSLYNQDRLDEAVEKFLLAVEESNDNPWQKINTLLRLGAIHYDERSEYAASFPYYDSLAESLAEQEGYDAIRKRHALLERYVPHYRVIQEQDSLLSLANMESEAFGCLLNRADPRKEISL